ncbi:MAG: hypothetical protein CVU87_06055 [Firmicutes bacterium HGW-Firmicutes-12]|nr:MAG: hypothetical protein CVU87_06055 [Firmicutes bacterium HGW-Firmicutes-12]
MIYVIARKIVKTFLLIFNNLKVVGEENIPSSAAVVLVANHVSYWDPPVLGCAIRRKVHFMAK